jgi:hypothetical protein
MSHTNDFETVISCEEALIRALVRMGIPREEIEVHETPVCLRTYYDGDPIKRAHIVVRRDLENFCSGRYSDVGWEKNDEGLYVGHIDEHDYSGCSHYDKNWQERLYTYCNVETLKLEYERKGMEYKEVKTQDGRLQLRAKFKTAPVKTDRIKTHMRRS